MAVTVSGQSVANSIRVDYSQAPIKEQVDRLLKLVSLVIQQYAPVAPAEVQNEAAIRVIGYLYDQPNAPAGSSYANAIRNSGAETLLNPYRTIGTQFVDADEATTTAGGGGLTAEQVTLIVQAIVPEWARQHTFTGEAGRYLTISSQGVPVFSVVEWFIDNLAQEVIDRLLPTSTVAEAGRTIIVKPDGSGFVISMLSGAHLADGTIPLEKLAQDVLDRVLPMPTVGNKGKFVAIKPDGSGWEVVDAPKGTGTGTASNDEELSAIDYVLDLLGISLRSDIGFNIVNWNDAETIESEAGFALGYWEAGATPTAYDDITWNVSHKMLPASTGYFVAIRVPSGYPSKFLRVNQVRSGVGNVAWPNATDATQSFKPFTLTDAPKHYDIYALFDGDDLLGIEAQRNDNLDLQIADTSYSNPQIALGQSVRDLHDLIDAITALTGEVSSFSNISNNAHFYNGFVNIQSDGTDGGSPHIVFQASPYVVFDDTAGSRTPGFWVGIGTNPETLRVQQHRSGNVLATYPGDGQYWRSYQSTGNNEILQLLGHYDCYFLASETSDAPITVELESQDTLTLQVGEASEAISIPLSVLRRDITSKLLPTPSVANKGKVPAIKADGTGYELVKAGGSGVGTKIVNMTIPANKNQKDFTTAEGTALLAFFNQENLRELIVQVTYGGLTSPSVRLIIEGTNNGVIPIPYDARANNQSAVNWRTLQIFAQHNVYSFHNGVLANFGKITKVEIWKIDH